MPFANRRPGRFHIAMKNHMPSVSRPVRRFELAARACRSFSKLEASLRTSAEVPDSIASDPARRPFLAFTLSESTALASLHIDGRDLSSGPQTARVRQVGYR